jgi:hypothetical protein
MLTPLVYRRGLSTSNSSTESKTPDCPKLSTESSLTPFSSAASLASDPPQNASLPPPLPASIRRTTKTRTKRLLRWSDRESNDDTPAQDIGNINDADNVMDSQTQEEEGRRLRQTLSTIDLDHIALRVVRLIGRRMSIRRNRVRDWDVHDIHDPPPPFEQL